MQPRGSYRPAAVAAGLELKPVTWTGTDERMGQAAGDSCFSHQRAGESDAGLRAKMVSGRSLDNLRIKRLFPLGTQYPAEGGHSPVQETPFEIVPTKILMSVLTLNVLCSRRGSLIYSCLLVTQRYSPLSILILRF